MKKNIKILLIVFIILLSFTYISNVYASGVNMNLPNNDTTTYGSTPSTNTSTGNTNQDSSVVVPNNSNEDVSNGLTISDMINIILCAIGVILILLGIAIIIRQRAV